MLKYWKWIVLAIVLTLLIFQLPPYNGEINKEFSEDDFRRYDLIIGDSALQKMDVLAHPDDDFNYTNSKVWFDAKILKDHDTLEGNVRLKGDKKDHYDSELLSWRLKYKEGGKKYVVSLQHPKTRNYISEWIFHELLKQEGLPYLNYDFVSVYVNDKFKGLYAEEEHFSNYNIEKKWNRVHGPIMRFDDEHYWPEGLYTENPNFDDETYAEAEINGLNFKKEERNTELYKNAVALLREYRNGELPVDQIFDLHLLAKFYALTDLVGGHHALRWINCRFYYNPKTKLFEPAGFDSDASRINSLALDDWRLNKSFHSKITSNPEFMEHYYEYLNKYSKKAFLDDFFEKHEVKLNRILEAFNYQFNVDSSSHKTDLYINQWVIFYNLKKVVIYTVLFLVIGLFLFVRIKKFLSKRKVSVEVS